MISAAAKVFPLFMHVPITRMMVGPSRRAQAAG